MSPKMKGGANIPITGILPVAETRNAIPKNNLSGIVSTTNNPTNVSSTKTEKNPLVDTYYDIREGIRQRSKAVESVNPLSYAHSASKYMEQQTHVDGVVKFVNIIYLTFFILSWILWFLSAVVSLFIWLLYFVISTIITLLIFLTPFMPIFIFIFLLGFVCQVLWDDVTVPIIHGLIAGYNGVINQWNRITDSVRHIGFDVPLRIMGKNLGFYVNLGGIDLPYGDTVNPDIKPFLPFVLDILYYMILEPLKLMTAGYIFRGDV
jgi:hypothetical protein